MKMADTPFALQPLLANGIINRVVLSAVGSKCENNDLFVCFDISENPNSNSKCLIQIFKS